MQDLRRLPFFALALSGTWLCWLIPAFAGWPIWQSPAVWFLFAGGACVPLTAIVLAWRSGQLKSLAVRLVNPRLIPARWWLVILLFVPLIHLLSGTLTAMVGLQDAAFLPSSAFRMSAAEFLGFAFFILLLGPLPEEIGWRGYALPALLSRQSPIQATLLLGAAWCAWHIPLFFLEGYYDRFGGAPEPLLFFGTILIISFFYTWVFMHTRGSILAAILFHFSVNLTGELAGLSTAGELMKTLLLALTAMAIVAWEQHRWARPPFR